ncbi:hypothetical protein [Bradyrhizobium sp. LTSP885]|uniref:hypothetical protein n=1 Tax=Bradyrhizobium sp. LTSP885 TaxID=1619232 RepID=UPI0012E0240D|nr:hypothetical protein [Bradyrhizobium sp. LTSP885]
MTAAIGQDVLRFSITAHLEFESEADVGFLFNVSCVSSWSRGASLLMKGFSGAMNNTDRSFDAPVGLTRLDRHRALVRNGPARAIAACRTMPFGLLHGSGFWIRLTPSSVSWTPFASSPLTTLSIVAVSARAALRPMACKRLMVAGLTLDDRARAALLRPMRPIAARKSLRVTVNAFALQ